MHSSVNRFKSSIRDLVDPARRLLLENSVLTYRPMNNPGDSVVFVTGKGDFVWKPVGEGNSICEELLTKMDKLERFAQTFHDRHSGDPGIWTQLDYLKELIEPESRHHDSELKELYGSFERRINLACDAADALPDDRAGSTLLIADTNALIRNPNLEKWQFDGIKSFTIVLTSTVLSELDTLKNRLAARGSPGAVSDRLIRQIKGYRDRGRLVDGVKLVNGRIDLFSYIVEPDFTRSLGWLDSSRNDDRLLAGVIELIRAHPRCDSRLVTADINFQTKAELADVPYIEPPGIEPPEPPTTM